MRRMLIKSLILAGILCGSGAIFHASVYERKKLVPGYDPPNMPASPQA